jgi:hypothetical protein
MSRPYSLDLRERVVAAVEAGASRHETADRFEVSVSSGSGATTVVAKDECEFRRRARIPLRNFRQGGAAAVLLVGQVGFVLHQRRGQRRERPGEAVARPHHGNPPGVDLPDDAGGDQPRNQAGPGQRRFA